VTDASVTTHTPSSRHPSLILREWHPVLTLDLVHFFAVLGVAAHLEGHGAAVEALQVPHGQTRHLNKMTKARGSQKDSSK
jgi:hypothetical protein